MREGAPVTKVNGVVVVLFFLGRVSSLESVADTHVPAVSIGLKMGEFVQSLQNGLVVGGLSLRNSLGA